jgi:hypothetical protein
MPAKRLKPVAPFSIQTPLAIRAEKYLAAQSTPRGMLDHQ